MYMSQPSGKLVRLWITTICGAKRLMVKWPGKRKPRSVQQLLDWLVADALENAKQQHEAASMPPSPAESMNDDPVGVIG
jgi:hypothetical protein